MGQILLVRHGQASWDAEDYDVLSETGWEQSRVLGRAFVGRGIEPRQVMLGGMRRHRETAEGCVGELAVPLELETDPGWDEFDHVSMLAKLPAPFEGRAPSKSEFQAWFEEATERWTGGEYDHDYNEPFSEFTGRVGESLTRLADSVGTGTAVVFTSGGPIAWACATLLADSSDVRKDLWRRLNPVCVNSGVSRLVTGRRGLTLVSFNDHSHLDPHPDLLTYR